MIAVAPLAAVIIALFAVLAYFALKYAIQLLVQVLPDWSIPRVGSLRGAVAGTFSTAEAYVKQTFAVYFGPLTKFITAPIHVATQFINGILSTIQTAYNTVNWVIHYAIPRAVNNALGLARGLISEAETYLLGVIGQAVTSLRYEAQLIRSALSAAIAAAEARAISTAQHLYNVAHAEIGNVYNLAMSGIAAAEHYALAQVQHLYNVIHGEMADALAAAERTAQRLVGIAITDVEHGVEAAVGAVLPGVEGAVAGVIDAAGEGFTDVTGMLKDLDWAKVGTIAGSAAGALTIAGAMARLAEECVIPNCRNLSGFGRDLQGLLGLFSEGALLAFLAAAATDPAGTAGAIHSEAAAAYRGVAHGFEHLVRAA